MEQVGPVRAELGLMEEKPQGDNLANAWDFEGSSSSPAQVLGKPGL